MLTPSALKTLINSNLADDRLFGIQVLLSDLIARDIHDAVTPQYRIQKTGSDITTLADLMTAISGSTPEISVANGYSNVSNLSTLPVTVLFPEIKVTLNTIHQADNRLTLLHGKGVFALGFVMNYINDGDTALPLKILNVVLV